jgi:hypothetical protein
MERAGPRRSGLSTPPEPHRHAADTCVLVGAYPFHRSGQLEVLLPVEQLFEDHPDLRSGQIGTMQKCVR